MHVLPTPAPRDPSLPLPPKAQFYRELYDSASALFEGERNWIANSGNLSALIYHGLKTRGEIPVNWVGLYTSVPNAAGAPSLVLGPFQGKVACVRINWGRGVCGTTASTRTTQIVRDVHAFPGHIACDPLSNSEIVVPLLREDGKVLGVLDLDCEVVNGYDEEDAKGLEALGKLLVSSSDWTFEAL